MSRLDYHSILDTNVNVDVDAEFDNPTIIDDSHHDDEHDHEDIHHEEIDVQSRHQEEQQPPEQDAEDIQVDVMQEDQSHNNIMDDEQDDEPFIIMEENQIEIHPSDIAGESEQQQEEHIPQELPLTSTATTSIIEGIEFPIAVTTPQSASHVQEEEHHETFASGAISLKGMSWTEKRERQKLQNRKAAERSRNKKRVEQVELEKQVNDMQSENAILRNRLSSLLAARSSPATIENGSGNSNDNEIDPSLIQEPILDSTNSITTASATTGAAPLLSGTGIDYNYINKLSNELINSKTILLERTIELSGLKTGKGESTVRLISGSENDVSEELKESRKNHLRVFGKLSIVKAEEDSLKTLLNHLKSEIDNLIEQNRIVSEKLDQRRNNQNVDQTSVEMENINGNNPTADTEIEVDQPQSDEGTSQSQIQDDQDQDHPVIDDDIQIDGLGGLEGEGEEELSNNIEVDETNEDKALDDIRGWIDAAVKDWDQNLPIPSSTSRENEEASELEEITQS
ncbi:uncharacterized protein IL334_000666 [Kwoniella shivajii]|uniref:BZIP domain-containing protein n=1 Tax=Kwoniella shivajii TaxID=564305 RepID=A0ABZ1CPS4_9TREE|nr:hypothetical protein IL334_000666 [Kwoniella shivajii]